MINPAGQCGDPSKCDIWLNTAPGISRSCLNMTMRAATAGAQASLGPLMPGFMPDPSSCAIPGEFATTGCPALDGRATAQQNVSPLCNPSTNTNGFALYTNPCYSSQCPKHADQSQCTAYCDTNN